MNVQLNIWDKLTRLILVLLVIASVMIVAAWYAPLVKENEHRRQAKYALDRKIEKEMEISKKLDAASHAMQDPKTIERLARERLSYAKPGETVIHFDAP